MGIFPTVRRENKKIFELPPPRKGVGQCCCWRMFFHWICQASRKDEWLETGSISRDSCDSDVTQDVNSVQIYSSTNQNLKNPWNFLGFLLFMTTIFIPSSYHPKFLIIGLKNGCKTPGSWWAFFSPLGMPGHNSQANPGMPGRSSVVSGAFTARESRTDFWRFCTWCFLGCFGMPSWFLMPG